MNILVHIFYQTHVCICLGHLPKIAIGGSGEMCGNSW